MSGSAHLVFSSGSAWYALPAHVAEEIVNLGEVTPVPNGAAHLLGVFSHRGEVIPLVGMEELRGGRSPARSRAVIVRTSRGAYALTSTGLSGVHELTDQAKALAEDGVGRHLRGPLKAGPHEVLAVDADGLFAFLSAPSHSR
jgi:purine-binding chemotaxis protein CheW